MTPNQNTALNEELKNVADQENEDRIAMNLIAFDVGLKILPMMPLSEDKMKVIELYAQAGRCLLATQSDPANKLAHFSAHQDKMTELHVFMVELQAKYVAQRGASQ